jgi:hypothetical protein
MQTNNNMILQFSTRNYGKILEEVKLFLMSIKNNLMFVSGEKKKSGLWRKLTGPPP